MGFEAQPLRFERQGAAAGERVVECGQRVPGRTTRRARVIGVLGTRSAPALPDPLRFAGLGRGRASTGCHFRGGRR